MQLIHFHIPVIFLFTTQNTELLNLSITLLMIKKKPELENKNLTEAYQSNIVKKRLTTNIVQKLICYEYFFRN